jgi:hypothetical protein
MIFNQDQTVELAQMAEIRKKRKTAYYELVLNPFSGALCRFPSPFPVPSTLLRDREVFQITTGAAGDFIGYFSPENMIKRSTTHRDYAFFAQNTASGSYYQSLTYNGHLGAAAGNYATQLSQTANGQYGTTYFGSVRLVAAGLRIKYIGRAELLSGLITAAVIQSGDPMGLTPLLSGGIAESLYPVRVTPDEGLVLNWFPFDAGQANFIPYGSGNYNGDHAQQVFCIHGFGLPTGTVLDIEVVRVYEYIPKPGFHELLTPATVDLKLHSTRDEHIEALINHKQDDFMTTTIQGFTEMSQSIISALDLLN